MAIFRIFNLTNITLVTALTLSAIAAWYSILGLIAIFAAAVIPIIVMGSALEVSKVVTTVWLHRHWKKAKILMRTYLTFAVITIAFITSMGIFGFLSKAHIDQGVPVGDVGAKIALLDEKIKIQKENIEVARKALLQMDAQVDQRLLRGESEQGAERAVQIRRQQAKERGTLQKEIATAQKAITELNEERAPIASQLRKVEAEVGPIKYIAAFIYNDNPDQMLLERAVRWVIILIIFVFDPLALMLIIASNTSREWAREEIKPEIIEEPKKEIIEEPKKKVETPKAETFSIKEHPYLFTPWKHSSKFQPKPIKEPSIETVAVQEDTQIDRSSETHEEASSKIEDNETEKSTQTDTNSASEQVKLVDAEKEPVITPPTNIETHGVTKEKPYKELGDGYAAYDGKHIRMDALKELKPEFFRLTADSTSGINTNFGTHFPNTANVGDIFVRVDALPNRVFKFNGNNWIEVNKGLTRTYLHDDDYIRYLINKIDNNEYDISLLTEDEKNQITAYLKTQSD